MSAHPDDTAPGPIRIRNAENIILDLHAKIKRLEKLAKEQGQEIAITREQDERLTAELAQMRAQRGDTVELQEAEQHGYQRGAAENEKLRAALTRISEYGGIDKPGGSTITLSAATALQMRVMARAALGSSEQ